MVLKIMQISLSTGYAKLKLTDTLYLHFFSAGTTDRFVRIFDCSLIGAEQTSEEAEEGPPEIVFVHGGHLAGITELHWNPLDEQFPWVTILDALC